MAQTKEEKAARRKARREKRKEAKATLHTQEPVDPTAEEPEDLKPMNAQRPYSGFKGIFFEKFTDTEGNPNCFRIYSEVFNLLGIIKLCSEDQKWEVSATRHPENWDFSGKHDSIDGAMKKLYDHYLPMVTRDMGLKGEFKPWIEPGTFPAEV